MIGQEHANKSTAKLNLYHVFVSSKDYIDK